MKRLLFIIAPLFALLLSACSGTPKTHYYKLNYDMPAAAAAALPVTIAMQPFDAELLYSGDRLVYRTSPYEVDYYHYRRWIAPPKNIAYEQVLKQFRASGAFREVVEVPAVVAVDYLLRTRVTAFEEWDEADAWFGQVALAFELVRSSDQQVIWRQEIHQRTPTGKRDPLEVVKAISSSVQSVADQAIAAIVQQLQKI